MIKPNHIIWALLGVILILILILVFRKPDPVVERFDEQHYLDLIESEEKKAAYYQLEAERWQSKADSAMAVSDSLEKLKPEIQHHYHEIYKFNSTATTVQLDSVIRSNW